MAPRALVRIVPWAGYEVLRQLVGRHLFCKNNLFLERPWVSGAGRHLFCKNNLFLERPPGQKLPFLERSGAVRRLFCKNYLFWRWPRGNARQPARWADAASWAVGFLVVCFAFLCFLEWALLLRIDSNGASR